MGTSPKAPADLCEPAVDVLDRSADDRIIHLQTLRPVLLQRFQKYALRDFEILLKASFQSGSRYRLLTGFTGTGKSTLLKVFRDRHPPIDLEMGVRSRPVLFVTTPPAATGHLLCKEILRAADVWTPAVRTNENLLSHVVAALRAQSVRVLVIDEMQHANLAKAGPKTGALLDTLKYLGEVLDVTVICSGTYSICAMMLDEDPQLERRFEQPVEMPLLDRVCTLPGFVRSLQKALPLRRHEDMCDDDVLDVIEAKSNMSAASVVSLLKYAAIWAIDTGQERIKASTIRQLPWRAVALDDSTAWLQRLSRV